MTADLPGAGGTMNLGRAEIEVAESIRAAYLQSTTSEKALNIERAEQLVARAAASGAKLVLGPVSMESCWSGDRSLSCAKGERSFEYPHPLWPDGSPTAGRRWFEMANNSRHPNGAAAAPRARTASTVGGEEAS
jgi:hypothetical protein